ncbi:MAG: hypothetical protein AB8B56_11630, partial [Crocinitomicaceae bacterium]
MKTLKTLLGALFITALTPAAIAQCNLSTIPATISVTCGTELDISAIGLSPTPALATNFNGGTLGAGWTTSVNGQYTNPCGPTLDGTPALWFGGVPAPRTLTTVPFDLSCGGQVCFDFDMATQGAAAPCEGPDQPNEGVFFQYSIDGGATWIDIFYFQPGPGGTSGPYLNWANYCFTIPTAAWSTATLFQWDQQVVSGPNFDHWGVDNITIFPSDCNFWYDWAHIPGFPDSATQTIVTDVDTTFYVTYTDSITFCYDSVVVTVDPIGISITDPTPLCGSEFDISIAAPNPNFYTNWAHVPGAPNNPIQTVVTDSNSTYSVIYTNDTLFCYDTIVVPITPLDITLSDPNPVCGELFDMSIQATNPNFWTDWSHLPGFPDSSFQTLSVNADSIFSVIYTDGTLICTDTTNVVITPLIIDIVGNPNPIECGDCAEMEVQFLNGNNGSIVDDFEGGFDPLTWGDVQSGTSSTICGGGATGDALYFNGPGADRYAETLPIDATTCGNIDFCLYMGNTASGGNPCENNENGDDIILEYSLDNGVTWVPIATYLQSLWDGSNFQQCFSEPMPAAAQTTSTMFRWRQVAFFAANGSDNWSLDDVNIACNPPTITYNWTTGTVDDATAQTPQACPGADELYTVFMDNTVTGCSANDTSTLFVNECQCFFIDFNGNVVCQPGGVFDVTGSFEYTYSPTTGTIEVEATNGTGTYSQSFSPPFTDSTVFNYTVTGIPNDGSTTTMVVYFSDSLSCTMTFDITPPVLPTVTGISGGATYCQGDAVAPILADVTGTGPWTVEYTIDGVPTTATGATSPIDLGNAPGVYVITGVSDQICLNAGAGTETITVNALPTIGAGTDQALCDGETTALSGTGGTSYTWDNGVTNGTTFTPPVGVTTYTVTGTDANGCVGTSTVTIDVTAYPLAPDVGPQGGDYCSSSSEIPPFVASGGGQEFTWYADPTLTIQLGTGP